MTGGGKGAGASSRGVTKRRQAAALQKGKGHKKSKEPAGRRRYDGEEQGNSRSLTAIPPED